eukprot:1139466-Pelagomonas_calceolata.AAC.5
MGNTCTAWLESFLSGGIIRNVTRVLFASCCLSAGVRSFSHIRESLIRLDLLIYTKIENKVPSTAIPQTGPPCKYAIAALETHAPIRKNGACAARANDCMQKLFSLHKKKCPQHAALDMPMARSRQK